MGKGSTKGSRLRLLNATDLAKLARLAAEAAFLARGSAMGGTDEYVHLLATCALELWKSKRTGIVRCGRLAPFV
jgi:hypothetical protein